MFKSKNIIIVVLSLLVLLAIFLLYKRYFSLRGFDYDIHNSCKEVNGHMECLD